MEDKKVINIYMIFSNENLTFKNELFLEENSKIKLDIKSL
jgi:hypothetical protein